MIQSTFAPTGASDMEAIWRRQHWKIFLWIQNLRYLFVLPAENAKAHDVEK